MSQALIFDCFGVIRVDPTILAYRSFGGDVEKDQEFINKVLYASSTGKVSSVELFSQHLGIGQDAWLAALQATSSLDEAMLAFIKTLRPQYRVALLSNIGKGGLQRWFEPGMLEQYFELAVASGDIGYAKPEPQAYQIVAERLGVRTEDCIMIDDRPDYCAGARAVGMQAVEYRSLSGLQRDLQTLSIAVKSAR